MEQRKVNYVKSKKCRLVNKYKTKGIVETEYLGGRSKKSTPHTDRKIIIYQKKKSICKCQRYNSHIGTRYLRKYFTPTYG